VRHLTSEFHLSQPGGEAFLAGFQIVTSFIIHAGPVLSGDFAVKDKQHPLGLGRHSDIVRDQQDGRTAAMECQPAAP
jgi:hypothetical protein